MKILTQKQTNHKLNTHLQMLSNTKYIKILKCYRRFAIILSSFMEYIATNSLTKVLHMDCN